jgi:hypothetical protein
MKLLMIISFFLAISTDIIGQKYAFGSENLSKEVIQKEIDFRSSSKFSSLDSAQLGDLYHQLSSFHFYAGDVDSSEHYFLKAFNNNPTEICDFSLQHQYSYLFDGHYRQFVDPQIWFSSNFSTQFKIDFYSSCEECCDITLDNLLTQWNIQKIGPNLTVDIHGVDSLLHQVKLNDQRYRDNKGTDFKLQEPLDSINRLILDTLLITDSAVLDNMSDDSQNSIWLVLQHSTDCEWNKRWFRVFLDACHSNVYGGGFLEQTFTRFYHSETGYCTLQDPEDAKEFIDDLKESYPKEYGDRFGYNRF